MQFKSFMEALKGKQHKIDKNKNGEIDTQDFKLLRKEEAEQLEEGLDPSEVAGNPRMYSADTVKKAFYHKNASAGDKESLARHLDRHHGNKEWRKPVKESEERMARSDYKTSASGRKSHKEIVFGDAESKDDEEDKKDMKEAKMSDADMAERERLVKGMKKNISGFKARYGNDAKSVMYATATKQAMKEETVDEGMTRQDRERAATEQERRERTLRDNPRIAAEVARRQAAAPAKKSGVKEEVEELDEKSEQAKRNKTMKNMMDASRGARFKINNPQSMVPKPDSEHKTPQAHNKAIGRALRNEELDEKLSVVSSGGTNKTKKDEKTGVTSGTFDKSPPFDGPYSKPGKPGGSMNRARTLARQGMKQAMKEDIDRFFEAKDEQEYGYEGDMAMNQLATLIRCAEMIKETLKPDTDLPEWVQSKITLASDYIVTAADYLHSELEEQAPVAPVPDRKYIKGTPEHKAYKATKKPINGMPTNVKEEVALDEVEKKTLSYGDFINNLLEYESKDGVYRNKGTYGGSYVDPEGADDAFDKKPMKPAAEKRGRGRPAGAKSGARKITGTSKLFK